MELDRVTLPYTNEVTRIRDLRYDVQGARPRLY